MKVAIIHAYSRRNAGDGLLVDESVKLARDAGCTQLSLIAWDPASFQDFPGVVLHPLSGRNEVSILNFASATLRPSMGPAALEAVNESDIVLAVGGGYLRSKTMNEYLRVRAAHISQFPVAGVATPFVYLPQSIGPHPPRGVKNFVDGLEAATAVMVRDDLSFAELASRGVPVSRVPDLAVMATSEREGPVKGAGHVGLIARSLKDANKGSHYFRELCRLWSRLDAELLVQSEGRGNDDPLFYRSMGARGPFRSVQAAMSSVDRPSVVISVRLHGAITSILKGTPSIHLSYERKGWGAFDDLGLPEYVHNARSLDLTAVEAQVQTLLRDTTDYWNRLASSEPTITQAREALVSRIRQVGQDFRTERIADR